MFQIAHGGVAAVDGGKLGPSPFFGRAKVLTIAQIEDIIESFRVAAVNAYSAGASGVQLHAAHGYLLSLFLSPVSNRRNDRYGGSIQNRARIVSEMSREIRRSTDKSFAIGLKMNGTDSIPFGVNQKLCSNYVSLLKDSIDLFEISCGLGNFFSTIRAQAPKFSLKNLLVDALNPWAFEEDYNLQIARFVKKQNPDTIVAAVGGWRNIATIQKALSQKQIDLVSISRPFVREPHLVREWGEGRKRNADCKSCHECLFGKHRPEDGLHCSFP
jgi:2,4-dienoyl-CoA reductase-like NADH-dependent reductase (Old Yellow Enzyme family)